MSAPVADVLQGIAAALAGAAVVSVALGALAANARLRCRGGLWALALGMLSEANQRWIATAWLDRLDGWLRKAGRPRDLGAAELVALVEVASAAALAGGIALALALQLGMEVIVASPLVGALCPAIWLRDRVRLRHRAISRALPSALDLLTLSVEAGLDFVAALSKVVEKTGTGPLGQELANVLKELRLGKTREEGLRNLARRVELPAVTSFVQALVHADRMGTPLGKVLRVLSTQLRIERTQRAEKLAGEAPVKLLLPLVLCIFPTLFLMLFGPLVHQLFVEGSF